MDGKFIYLCTKNEKTPRLSQILTPLLTSRWLFHYQFFFFNYLSLTVHHRNFNYGNDKFFITVFFASETLTLNAILNKFLFGRKVYEKFIASFAVGFNEYNFREKMNLNGKILFLLEHFKRVHKFALVSGMIFSGGMILNNRNSIRRIYMSVSCNQLFDLSKIL